VLAYFGYPQAHEHDAERAVRAGLILVEAVPKLETAIAGTSLQVRVGIATGLVVVGDLIGSGEAQERGIVGETPNLAARLQATAEPNMVVIAESTRRLLGNLFELQDLGPKDLKRAKASIGCTAVSPRQPPPERAYETLLPNSSHKSRNATVGISTSLEPLSLLKKPIRCWNLYAWQVETDVLSAVGCKLAPVWRSAREPWPLCDDQGWSKGRVLVRAPSAIFKTRSLLSARLAGTRGCVSTTSRPIWFGAGM
jgi:hypothetical protein